MAPLFFRSMTFLWLIYDKNLHCNISDIKFIYALQHPKSQSWMCKDAAKLSIRPKHQPAVVIADWRAAGPPAPLA